MQKNVKVYPLFEKATFSYNNYYFTHRNTRRYTKIVEFIQLENFKTAAEL